MFVYLLKNKNIVLSRDNIFLIVWGYDYEGEMNVVDVFIGYLRKKLEEDIIFFLIQIIWGVGYVIRKD